MKTIIVIMMFLVLGALFIISNNNLALSNRENFVTFTGMYLGWMEGIYSNVAGMTGYVVKLDWLPK